MITIKGQGWEDCEEVELLQLPVVGATIETKYGKCQVTQADALPGGDPYEGKIVCRTP